MRELTDQEKCVIASALMSKALVYKRFEKELPASNANLKAIYAQQAEEVIALGQEFYTELPLSR